ncbi:MAG: hypothetical protein WCT08_03845 [Patescibacteria group bacterium]|jgi:hypothetical protein
MRKKHFKVVKGVLGSLTILSLTLLPYGAGMGSLFKAFTASAEVPITISGVIKKPDGTPAQYVHPAVYTPDHLTEYYGNETGTDGAYTIHDVMPGTYIFSAYPDYSTGLVQYTSDAFTVLGTEVTITKDVTLTVPPKTVTGTITYKGTTTPVAGVIVNCWSYSGGGGASATTNASGVYTLTLGANPKYGINLSAPAGADWSYNEPQYDVTFAADATTETRTVNFSVTKATATITGAVTYATGGPVTSGNINAWSTMGAGGGGNATINADGTYTLRLPAGSFNVGFWNPDPSLTAISQIVNVADGQTITANFSVKAKTAHITGTIVNGSGTPIPDVRINAWCQPIGTTSSSGPQPGINGNATSAANGTFDLTLLSGRCNVNIDNWVDPSAPSTAMYVSSTMIPEVILETDTSSVAIGSVVVVKADATIRVTVKDEAGAIVTGVNGWVWAQKAEATEFGPGQNYGGSLNPDGRAIIKLPSSVFSLVKLGMNTPPESEYSVSDAGSTIAIAADSTTDATLTLVRNSSSIYGSLVDPNGIPLSKCTPPAGQFTFGEIFVNNMEKGGRNAQFKEDCSYRVSVAPGKYFFNYHFAEGSGLLNSNPSPDPIVVSAGQNVAKNITALVGDAKIKVQVLNSAGKPMSNVWVNADNNIEVFGRAGDMSKTEGPKDLAGQEFKDKNGKKADPFQTCMTARKKKDTKQINLCKKMSLPGIAEGPGGCKNVMACVDYCSKKENQEACGKFKGPDTGTPGTPQTGPGGCKTETECKTYCSKPENESECMKFGPPEGAMTGASFFKGKVKGETTAAGDKIMGAPNAQDMKNILNVGGQTDGYGNATLTVLSGHTYEVRANPQPGTSSDMPAKSQVVDMKTSKNASVTLAFRQADAKITGRVAGGGPFGYCHGWEETGNFSGGEARGGTYEINVSKGVWHIGCDSAWDNNFARSEEITIVVDGSKKVITQDFKLDANANFRLPAPFSTTFDSTQAQSIILEDGTSITAGASAFATSGNVTLTATPTANLMSMSTAKPAWYGYEFKALNSSGAEITKFNSNVTITFKYTDKMLEGAGVEESALLPKYFDETSNSWKSPDNTSQDLDNNTITVLSDHFSKHSLVTAASSKALTTVTKGTGKNKGTFTVNKKKVTAFKGSDLNIATANFGTKLGQLILVTQASVKSGNGIIKAYNTSGKLVKTINPGLKGALSLKLSDLTKDGTSDVVASSGSDTSKLKVYNIASKYKTFNISTGAKYGSSVSVTTLEAHQSGMASLTILVKNRNANDLKIYKYSSSKGFQQDTGLNASNPRFKISGTSVSLVILKPTITSISGTITTTKATGKISVKGTNFTRDTVATIGNIGGTVKYKNSKEIQITIDGTQLSKGKKTLKIVTGDGGIGTKSITVK